MTQPQNGDFTMRKPSSIFQRENGYWYYRRHVNGKYIRISLETKNKKEALKIQKMKDEEFELVGENGIQHNHGTSVKRYKNAMDEYLTYKNVNFKSATYNNDRKRLELIQRYIGNPTIDKITESIIIEFISQRQNEVSYTTYRGDLICLKAFLSYYHRRDVILSNPFRYIPIKQINAKPVYLNYKEVKELMSLEYPARPWIENFFRIALLTGFRRGELVTLKWKNIDLRRGCITIFGKSGKRHFPIDGYAELLKTLQKIPQSPIYVFHQSRDDTKRINKDRLSNYVREVFNFLGLIKRIRFIRFDILLEHINI